jgi:hypothetical protein
MAGKTPKEAVDNFVGPLQQALSCVTNAVLLVTGGYYVREEPHIAAIGDGGPVELPGPHDISLVVRHHYRIVEDPSSRGPWKVSTAGYLYSLKDPADQDIVSYHWHPYVEPTYPHLHLGAGAHAGRSELVNAHLPAGRIALEEVLRLALNDFHVRPARADWADVLSRTLSAFEDWRTWA